MPNDRPRYYCVAVQKGALAEPDARASVAEFLSHEDIQSKAASKILTSIPALEVQSSTNDEEVPTGTSKISSFLDTEADDSLRVPEKLLNSNASWCFDIVTPNDRRSRFVYGSSNESFARYLKLISLFVCFFSCFTSSYGRYIRGTGSILYDDPNFQVKLLKPDQREFQQDWGKDYDFSKLRYFSGLELSRLFGFREDFSFPSNCTTKQQWKLVGNSLNVRVASRLVELGLRSMK